MGNMKNIAGRSSEEEEREGQKANTRQVCRERTAGLVSGDLGRVP